LLALVPGGEGVGDDVVVLTGGFAGGWLARSGTLW
jgi:hypothetical protein